jgi:hypothetical protein
MREFFKMAWREFEAAGEAGTFVALLRLDRAVDRLTAALLYGSVPPKM